MRGKKILKALLFPHIAVMLVLLPVATVFLVYSMVFMGSDSPIAIVSYLLAFYTMTVWCMKLPAIIKFFKTFKNENKYIRLWLEDTRLRVNISLYGSLLWNTAYAVFQLGLGFYHSSFWFFSLAAYYIMLAVMRFFLVRHTRRHLAGEKMYEELIKYRACGIVLLVINLALSLMVFFMIYWNRTFHHHEITTISLAAYTFTSLTLAIINAVRSRNSGSPVYSAAKAISLACATVSVLTLETTMLTTFGDETTDISTRRILLGTSGAVIALFIIIMAVYMIVNGTKKIKLLKTAEE